MPILTALLLCHTAAFASLLMFARGSAWLVDAEGRPVSRDNGLQLQPIPVRSSYTRTRR
jgi:hypothetical protein